MNQHTKDLIAREETGVKNFFQEFKAFINKGNVVDLAVAVVIGAAFGKIVNSIVSGLITPLIGLMTGGVDLSHASVQLRSAVGTAGTEGYQPPLMLNYGETLQATIDFIIVAFAIFVLLKLLIKLRLKAADQPAPPAAKTPEVTLLEEIRDLLKKDNAV